MSISVRALILIVVGLALLGAPFAMPDAHAGPLSKPAMAEARNHLAHGNKLYNVRSFDEAVTEYKAGALIEPAPVFDYNLGQCYRLTGKYQEAIWHYERFLARGKPQGELLDAVNDFIAQMKSELDRKAMTQKPTEPAPTAALAVSQPPPPTQAAPRPDPRTVRSTEAWYDDRLGWGVAAAGGVGVAVGVGFLVNAASLHKVATSTRSEQEHNRAQSKATARNQLGAIVGIGGAGLLLAGIIKLAVHSSVPSRATTKNVDVEISGDSLLVVGRF